MFEDAFLWIDDKNNFHVLCHVYKYGEARDTCVNSTVSAHLFSDSGYSWALGEEQPYTTSVMVMDNTTLSVSTR